jgi:hypothetical protein
MITTIITCVQLGLGGMNGLVSEPVPRDTLDKVVWDLVKSWAKEPLRPVEEYKIKPPGRRVKFSLTRIVSSISRSLTLPVAVMDQFTVADCPEMLGAWD